jgi:hypothetical protein
MAEVVVFDIDAQSAIQKLAQLRADTNALKEAQKQLAEEVKKGNKDAATSYESNAIILKNVANEQRVLSRQVEGYAAVQKSATDTTKFANNSIQENRDLLKQLTATYIGLKNPTAAQTEQIRKLSDQLKEQESAIGNNVRNVGNYQGALKNATSEIKVFGVSVNDAKLKFNTYNDALKDAKTQLAGYITGQKAADGATKLSILSTGGLSAAMNVLRLALIATGIGAIVVAFGALAAAILSTQKGTDALNMAMTQIGAVFKATLGVAQELGFKLIEVFSSPKQAISDLIDFLQQNLVNRLNGFKVALDGILERDTKKLTDGILQIGTGITNLTDKAQDFANKTGKFFKDNLSIGEQIAKLNKEIQVTEIDLNKQRAIAQARENELLLIARNTNLSAKERKAAVDEIIANTEKLTKIEEDLQNKKIKALQLEQSLNDTGDKQKQELADLEAELINIQQQGQRKRIELQRTLNSVQKEQINDLKKTIPLVEKQLEGFDEFEKRITKIEKAADKAREEMLKFLSTIYEPEEFFEEDQDVFDKILSNFDKFKAGVIDSIDEFDVIQKLTGLDERGVENVIGSVQVITGAVQGLNSLISQSIANRQQELQDAFNTGKISEEEFNRQAKELALKEFRRQKAFNLVQATMDTVTGAISAYANTPGGPIIKGIAAAIATTFGIAQTAVIAAQQPPKFSEGGEISIDGKSHSQGGEVVTVGGRPVAEVEGGEGLYVMKKNAYQKIKQFSAINEAFGGKSWLNGSSKYLADGGAINTTLPILESRGRVNSTIEQNRILSQALRQLPAPVLSIKEFEKKQAVKDKSVRISEL